MSYTRVLGVVAGVLVFGTFAYDDTRSQQISAKHNSRSGAFALQYDNLRLAFEQNQGQAPAEFGFVAHGRNYTALMGERGMMLALARPHSAKSVAGNERAQAVMNVLRMSYPGAVGSELAGLQPLPGKVNYFLGSDPARWQRNVATFARVGSGEMYPGISVVYYGTQGVLESDFEVKAGANPKEIRMKFEGADAMRISEAGDLVVGIGGSNLALRRPIAYQERNGNRHVIGARYVLNNVREAAFELGPYDHSRTLVIDPQLEYSTFLGGMFDDGADDIAVDQQGNAYVTGFTNSPNFPNTMGGPQPLNSVAFVSKFDPTGTALVYSTFLGTNIADGQGIAVDDAGNAYVTGEVFGTNFPVTPSAFQNMPSGNFDAFLTKLDPSGSTLLYSSYLGGNAQDIARAIAVDNAGNAYIAGNTGIACLGCNTWNFPTTPSAFQTSFGSSIQRAWVAHFDTTKSGVASLVYSTLLGGSAVEFLTDVTVRDGEAYVVGQTESADFPVTPGAYQTACNVGNQSCADAFITKLNNDGSGLVFSTFLGGTSTDDGNSIALDAKGDVYVTGTTRSTDFPLKKPFQAVNHGGVNAEDVFITKLNAQGSGLIYSTYLGGTSDDVAFGIAVDRSGNAYVSGLTLSSDFPVRRAIQNSSLGPNQVFVSKLNEAGTHLHFSTYLGGTQGDLGLRIRVDERRAIYVAGWASSPDFPITPGAFQTTYGGDGRDAFVSKICVQGCR